MDSLPLLLAGPVVRRVDPRSVAIWVAFRDPGTVTLSIWESRQKSSGAGVVQSGDSPITMAEARTRRLGKRLHVALVRAGGPGAGHRFTPPLRPGAIYCYDVVYQAEEGAPKIGLKALGLLSDDPKGSGNNRAIEGVSSEAPKHLALGYADDVLPSFVTVAAAMKDVRLAHASCRKVHGPGTDALSWLDKEIATTLDKPDQRIQQLFLTGDQIYADDVPTCLLPVIHELALVLQGGEDDPAAGREELPLDDTVTVPVTLESAPPMRRTMIVRHDGGFTSVEAQNHLLTFGEYAALYLLAWSPRVWRAPASEDKCYENARGTSRFTATELDPLFVAKDETPPASDTDFRNLVQKKNAVAFKAERQRVLVYAATVAKVARVLANTPTYMIFDDHDVTDDWNLNATWRNRVMTRPLGRAVVRNALLAYVFFQAWGSDPESFAPPMADERPPRTHANHKLLAAAEAYLATPRGRPRDSEREIDGWIGFEPGTAERAKFHFEVPGTLYQVRVLDSRTRRTYPFSVGVAPAFLLGQEPQSSLADQVPKGPRPAGTELLLVVSPTPVLGPELLERMLIPLVVQAWDAVRAGGQHTDTDAQPLRPGEHDSSVKLARSRTQGAMFIDTETWPSNERALHELLNRLATHERVVILGGDVHYGTNIAVDWYTFDRGGVGVSARTKARIVQLTSSAARNAFEKRIEAVYQGYHWLSQWLFGPGFEGIAWKGRHRLSLPADAKLSLLRFARMREEPSLLPAWGWPEGTSIAAGDDPDWAWRMTMLRDERPDEERGGPVEDLAEQLESDVNAAELLPRGIERARAAAAIHQKAQSLEFAPLREVVFTNNVGIVTFEPGGGGLSVIHTMLSTEEEGYPEDEPDDALVTGRPLGAGAEVSTGLPNTLIRASLVPSGEPPRPYAGMHPPDA